MKFSVHRAVDTLQTIFNLRYFSPDGREKRIQTSVNEHTPVADTPYIAQQMLEQAKGDVMATLERCVPTATSAIANYVCDTDYGTTGTATIQYYGDNNNNWRTYVNGQWVPGENIANPSLYSVGGNTMPQSFSRRKISFMDGRRKLIIEKDDSDEICITPEDIQKARMDYIKDLRLTILTKRAEHKAEDLLKMFISEIDFRNYKEKGFFLVKSGNRIFRIHRDTHKWIDMYESNNGVLVPRNRLCVHTERRELPFADEALSKLMLIKANKVEEHSNGHGVGGLKQLNRIEDLLLPESKDENCSWGVEAGTPEMAVA